MHCRAVMSILGLCVAAGLSGCQSATTVSWEPSGTPRHEVPGESWHYQFVYHPNAQTYYEPFTQRYFWFEDGAWRGGDHCPPELSLDPRLAKVVYLENSVPFIQHDSTYALHPARQPVHPYFDPHAAGQFLPTQVAGWSVDEVDR